MAFLQRVLQRAYNGPLRLNVRHWGARSFGTLPEAFYLKVINSFILPHAVYVACQMKLPNYVGKGQTSVAEVAAAAGTKPELTERLLKFLAVYGVFERVAPGVYRHNLMSDVLRTDHPQSVWNLIMFRCEIAHKSALEWPAALRGECTTSFNKAFNTDLSFWDFLFTPENATLKGYFDGAMVVNTSRSTEAILREYPWRDHGKATVVDVGGGMGHLLASLLREYSQLRGIVFDLKKTVDTAVDFWEEKYSDVKQRAEFAAGSFFEEVPEGGDVYILKHIIHDWNDEECVRILTRVAAAMRKTASRGSRPHVLIIDRIYDFPPKFTQAADMDLMMMTLISGKERSLDEFKGLLTAAGLQFEMSIDFSTMVSAIRGVLA